MHHTENFRQLIERYPLRIENNLGHFRMSRTSGTDRLVARVLNGPASVADTDIGDAIGKAAYFIIATTPRFGYG